MAKDKKSHTQILWLVNLFLTEVGISNSLTIYTVDNTGIQVSDCQRNYSTGKVITSIIVLHQCLFLCFERLE